LTSSLRTRLAPGRAAFNRGDFFEAHELWEDVWRELAGADRTFVQGLIQIAAGLHHLKEGRPRPGARVLARGVEKLEASAIKAPTAALLRDVRLLIAALEAGGSGDLEARRIRFLLIPSPRSAGDG
jgi:predicted metal-dependent hydrolase